MDSTTEVTAPPPRLSVRSSSVRSEWWVWDSFMERPVTRRFDSQEVAETTLLALQAGRAAR